MPSPRIDSSTAAAQGSASRGSFLTQPPTPIPTAAPLAHPLAPAQPQTASPSIPIPVPTSSKSLDGYGCHYYKLMIADYKSISNPQPVAVRNQLDALVARGNVPASWDDVYLLERGLYAVMPDTTLRARMPFLRSEFEEAVTDDEYQDYLKTNPPDIKAASIDVLRGDALALVDQVQWRALTVPYFEYLRRTLLRRQVITTGLCIMVVAAYLVYLSHREVMALLQFPNSHYYSFHLLTAILCGILGGAVSSIQRIQALPIDGAAVSNLRVLQGQHVALLVSPFVGGISATLLFYLCAGSLLPSDLFPKIDSIKEVDPVANPWCLYLFASFGTPTMADAGKLIVWSFIAGFSERFIPDTISRLSAKISS